MLNFNDDDDLNKSIEIENNLEVNNNKQSDATTVNSLLPLDDDRVIVHDENGEEIVEESIEDNEEIDPAKVVTKHDFVSSPWTKLSIVGGFFAIGFGAMYLSLNSLMGGGGETAKKPEPVPTPTPTPFAEQKDGDAYAKLALQKQETDLQNLNGKEETIKEEDKLTEEKDNKTTNTTQNTTTTTKNNKSTNTTTTTTAKGNKTTSTATEESNNSTTTRASTRNRNNNSSNGGSTSRESNTRRSQRARVPVERPSRPVAATIPKLTLPSNSNRSTVANNNSNNKSDSNTDPIANIERLRGLSSLGRINYTRNTATTIASSNTGDSSSGVSTEALESRRRREVDNTTSSNIDNNENQSSNSNSEIQKLTPKWEPRTNKTSELRAQNKQMNLMNVSYETEESQILEERAPQYLVVGSSAKAKLVTPLMIAGDKPNKNLRFVAQLEEPIKSNTGNIAIPAGTQVAIIVHGVDGGFGMDAEVVGILKDGTEYPISPGTITVLAKGGNPLIARPYKGKGGEIAGYDVTLGAIAGLAKIGEVINQPDQSTTAITPLGGTVTSTSGNQRNIPGAFLEGAFGALATSVGTRTQAANAEVASRPNVWYVPAKTQITLRVNRSIQL